MRLLLFDVDGVLTDGAVLMHADGSESKSFHIRDGAAMVWAQRAGLSVGLLSARTSGATAQRAAQLGIRIVSQGVAQQAGRLRARSCRNAGLDDAAVAYMGDDLLDLPVLARVGSLGGAGRRGARSARARGLGQPVGRRPRRGAGADRAGAARAGTLGRRRAAIRRERPT